MATMQQAASLTRCSLLQQRRVRAPFATGLNSPLVRPNALSRRGWQLLVRAEGEGSSAAPPQPPQPQPPQPEEDEDTLIEKQLASKRRKPKEAKQQRPQVISAARDQVYGGGPLTPEQQLENRVVSSLALLFLVILLEGLFLGASGFMSESVDQFAQDFVYPVFSPSIGLFLLGSSVYGLWKTYFQGRGSAPTEKK